MARNPSLDLYAVLGVHPNAEDIVIRAAFKALAQRYHPDRYNGSMEEAHRRMADLTNAYETLADPARRRKYDRRRGHAGRTARFYFKNPAREHPLRFGALAARAAAAKQRRYRMAVYGLMVAVVILSAFNIHQHASQIRELFTGNRGAPPVITETDSRSAPEATTSTAATAPASPSIAPVAVPGPVVKSQPIGQGGTRPIGQGAAETPTHAPQATDAAAAIAAPLPGNAGTAPARSIAKPASGKSAPVARAPVTSVPVASAPVASTPASNAPVASVSTTTAPPSSEPEPCKEAVAALGLCNRISPAKER